MDYKEETLKLLEDLKILGFDRRTIEKEMKYNDGYLDQAISRGGNNKLLVRLKQFHLDKSKSNDAILEKMSESGKEIGELKVKYLALLSKLNVLIPAFADLSAKFQGKEFSQVYTGLSRAMDLEFEDLKASLKEPEQK